MPNYTGNASVLRNQPHCQVVDARCADMRWSSEKL